MMDDREKLIELSKTLLNSWAVSPESMADFFLSNGVTVQKWISVSERLPEEHDSVFAKLYGTNKWIPNMFRKVSDTVPVILEYADGQKSVNYLRTYDGEWNLNSNWQAKVTHWMPKPELPKECE